MIKKLLLFIFSLIVVAIAGFIFISQNNSKNKTWELVITYSQKSDTIRLKSLKLLNTRIRIDNPLAKLSPYKLSVLDVNGAILYSEQISINQLLSYSIFNDSNVPIPQIPDTLDSIIYVPYQKNAVKILIERNGIGLLQIVIPKEISQNFHLPDVQIASNESYADTCSYETVFISDNYTDMNEFHTDVANIQNLFARVNPYSSFMSIFNFKSVVNTVPLNCQKDLMCIRDNYYNIVSIGRSRYLNARWFIVVTKINPSDPVASNGTAGLAVVGGNISVVAKVPRQENSLAANAVHEFLGHSVASLYDRYVYKTSIAKNLFAKGPKTNCTDNPSGESFWTGGAYRGCTNPEFYAPAPPNCRSNNPSLDWGGRNDTVMSSSACAGSEFDIVERRWIETRILPPLTNNCAANATPTPTPSPSPSPQPTQATDTPTPVATATPIQEEPTLTPVPTDAAPTNTPAPTPTPGQSSVTYECHEVSDTSSNNSLQLKTLECKAIQ